MMTRPLPNMQDLSFFLEGQLEGLMSVEFIISSKYENNDIALCHMKFIGIYFMRV